MQRHLLNWVDWLPIKESRSHMSRCRRKLSEPWVAELGGAIDRKPRCDYVPAALPGKRATHPGQLPGPPVREFRALAFLPSQMSFEDRDVRQPQ
jgi:hypothetical protein